MAAEMPHSDVRAPDGRAVARWETAEPRMEDVRALAEALSVDPLVATLLVNREVCDAEEARRFLDPRLGHLPDPFAMRGMTAAVDRLEAALQRGERIAVWGDYDVDGVTSASQLIAFFRAIGVAIDCFVPDRFVHGYGLAEAPVRELAAEGVAVLVTVDCGVSDHHEITVAQELGVDVIVADHHQVPPELPPALAVLDPIRDDCPYPFAWLAACGVTFMLLVALRARLREAGRFGEGRAEPDLRRWLDLTAIGTVADMVPLIGVNRTIVAHGLQQIASTDRPGIRALCDVAGISPDRVNAGRIGFQLGPRINAAGRIAHAGAGVDLLTAEDGSTARDVAARVDTHNEERRGLQERIFEEVCAEVDAHPDPAARRAIVHASADWHPGVLGIVASKIVERYHRPTVLMTIEEGVAKGSARSIAGFRLVEHLRQLDHLLDTYGGHDHAAGLALAVEHLEAFRQGLEDEARAALSPHHLQPRLRIDAELPLDRVDWELVESLGSLAPHGLGNPEPTFLARGATVHEARAVGRDGSHLKLQVEGGGRSFDAIAFGQAEGAPHPGERVDLVYVPEVNEFQGRRRLQLRVKALRPVA